MAMNVNEIFNSFSGVTGLNYGIDTAIKALRPGAKFEIDTTAGIFKFNYWDDSENRPEPTKEEILKEFEFQKKIAEYYAYAYQRCKEYPDGFQQLDMIWHAIEEGKDLKESEWFKKIKEIKERNPKPEGSLPTRE